MLDQLRLRIDDVNGDNRRTMEETNEIRQSELNNETASEKLDYWPTLMWYYVRLYAEFRNKMAYKDKYEVDSGLQNNTAWLFIYYDTLFACK